MEALSIERRGSAKVYTNKKTGARMRYQLLAPGVMLLVNEGVQDEAFAREGIGCANLAMMNSGHLVMLSDSRHLRSMATEFRDLWIEWFRKNRGHFKMVFLFKSPLMAMSANIANWLSGGKDIIESYSDPEKWVVACRRHCPDFRPVDVDGRVVSN